MKNQIGVNLHTDNIPKDLLIGMPEEEYIRYKQQEEELENLRKIEKEHQKLNGELREEIKRLNNIINEFEKWLDEEYQYADKHIFPGSMAGVAMGQINRTKNKLHELKGEDKE